MAYSSSYTDKVVNNKPELQKFDTNYKPQIDTAKYENLNNAYQNMFNQYKQGGQQYLDTVRKQTQMQMSMLNQQLSATKAKYQAQGNQQANQINANFVEQDKAIDKQGYNQLKYANQMGANRGMSASAQQRGLDNYVGQQTTALMNKNATDRNTSLSDLAFKIQSMMADADSEYATNAMNVMSQGMDKEANFMQQMNQQEFQFQLQNAKDLVAKAEEEGKLKFQTEMQRVQYENQLAMQMYQSDLGVAQNKDNMVFQDQWKQKDYSLQQQKMAQDYAQAQASLALQREKFAYQKAQDAKSKTEEGWQFPNAPNQEAYNELMAYAMQPKENGGLGLSYYDAQNYTKQTMNDYYNNGMTPTQKKEAVAKQNFQQGMNIPVQDFLKGSSAIFGTSPVQTANTSDMNRYFSLSGGGLGAYAGAGNLVTDTIGDFGKASGSMLEAIKKKKNKK